MKNFTAFLKNKKYKWFLLTTSFLFTATFLKGQTVVDVIANSEDHTKLEHAILESGFDATLNGEGPFTVFAPTDEAIDALLPGVWNYLLMDPQGMLTNVLRYHVAEIEVLSGNLSDEDNITTMLGEDVLISIAGEDIYVNDAKIILADVQAENGVVHVIDAALVPGSVNNIQNSAGNFNNLEVYPNPARNYFNINLILEKPQVILLEIYTISGIKISERNLGLIPSGRQLITQPVNNLKNGIYFIVIGSSDTKKVKRVQVMK